MNCLNTLSTQNHSKVGEKELQSESWTGRLSRVLEPLVEVVDSLLELADHLRDANERIATDSTILGGAVEALLQFLHGLPALLSLLLKLLQPPRPSHGEPLDLLLFEELQNVRLGAVQVARVDALDVDDEVDVLPLVVVLRLVREEAGLRLPVKGLLVDVANEAVVPHVIVSLTLVVSQLGEGVDDDTEDDVEQDCDDQEEEGQIVDRPEVETLAVLRDCRLGGQEVADTATTPQTVIQLGQEAVHHGHADGVTFAVQQASVDIVIVERVVEEDEADSRVDVNEDRAQHGRHAKLEAVLGDTLDNVL
jgi:hypothetical protein